MEKSMERRSGNVEREGSRNITICKEIQRNVQSITDVLAVIHSTRRATSRYLLARAVFIFWTRYASLHVIFIIMTVCARGVVGFSTSLTSTPRCDPIWSSAVRRVWAKAAGISFTCECAYGQFTNDLLPSSYLFVSQDRHACVMYGRVSCAGRFVPGWFSMRVFWGSERSALRTAVRCILEVWWIFTTVCFRWRRPGCWGAPVWQHTLLTAKHWGK